MLPPLSGQNKNTSAVWPLPGFPSLPVAPNEEAGLTVYQNDRYHYDLAVTKRDGRLCLVVRKTVGT